jgi:hypothetical protein
MHCNMHYIRLFSIILYTAYYMPHIRSPLHTIYIYKLHYTTGEQEKRVAFWEDEMHKEREIERRIAVRLKNRLESQSARFTEQSETLYAKIDALEGT